MAESLIQTDASPLLDVAEVSPTWLTDALRPNGHLRAGSVESIRRTSDASVHARTARLEIAYSADSDGALPASLFLKICKEGSALFGDSEVRFYTAIAAAMPDPPMPRCWHAAYDSQTGRYHLLLEDLTATHYANFGVIPTLRSALKTVDALARLHAHWWDSDQLADAVGRIPTAEVVERYANHALPGVAPMLDYLGDRVSAEDRRVVERVFERHPALLIARGQEGRHLTCIHGDPNPGNILSPHDPEGRAFLIDRQPFPWSLTTWTGTSDLAYMMVHWWDTGTRRTLEEPLLRRYLEQLEAGGVEAYSWERLWADYRLASMQSFYVAADWNIDPAEQKQMEWVWWPQLQKTLAAYDDLHCEELL